MDLRVAKELVIEPVHCSACEREVTSVLHFLCTKCAGARFCASCFSQRKPFKKHDHFKHEYTVSLNLASTKLSQGMWTAKEDVALVEGVSLFGFGNWSQICEHVQTKSSQDCQDRFLETCVFRIDPGARTADAMASVDDSALRRKSAEAKGMSGYLPLRGDFDVEYANDAELLVADVDFEDDDGHRDLKLKVLKSYLAKLKIRKARKKFVLERGLLDPRRRREEDRRLSRADAALVHKLQPLARFNTKQGHEDLVGGLLKERRLREEIRRLQAYKTVGVRTLAEADAYERLLKRGQGARRLQALSNLPISDVCAEQSDEAQQVKRQKLASMKTLSAPMAPLSAMRPDDVVDRQSKFLQQLPSAQIIGPKPPLDVERYKGAYVLMEKEKRLCSSLRLTPSHYVAIKEDLIKRCAAVGFLSKSDAVSRLNVEVSKSSQIFDFMVRCEWVKKK